MGKSPYQVTLSSHLIDKHKFGKHNILNYINLEIQLKSYIIKYAGDNVTLYLFTNT